MAPLSQRYAFSTRFLVSLVSAFLAVPENIEAESQPADSSIATRLSPSPRSPPLPLPSCSRSLCGPPSSPRLPHIPSCCSATSVVSLGAGILRSTYICCRCSGNVPLAFIFHPSPSPCTYVSMRSCRSRLPGIRIARFRVR